MKSHHSRTWTQAEIALQAFEMLAIGNVAAKKAQQRNREQGIANLLPDCRAHCLG